MSCTSFNYNILILTYLQYHNIAVQQNNLTTTEIDNILCYCFVCIWLFWNYYTNK